MYSAMIDYVVFILTHGRADNVVTYKTLKKCGYTGRIVLVIDNEDKQADEYYAKYGRDNVFMFDKKAESEKCDTCDNLEDRRVILFARNVCFEIAEKLGYKYFIELDDDYNQFGYTYASEDGTPKEKSIKHLDKVWQAMWDFYVNTPVLTIAMAQRGDFVGGKENDIVKNEKLKRKAMNSFFCSTDRPFRFMGRINEDVNAYTSLGSRGHLFFTVPLVALHQKQTQSNKGGMTDIYLDGGTYRKSFYTVINMPSAVKVGVMGTRNPRLHHNIEWNNAVPRIVSETYRKE